jgi:hypothetical protein
MEPEGSLPHSQEPTTRPCSDQSNQVHTTIPLSEELFEYYTFVYAWVWQVVCFPQISPLKPCIHLFFPLYELRALPISFFLIWSPE